MVQQMPLLMFRDHNSTQTIELRSPESPCLTRDLSNLKKQDKLLHPRQAEDLQGIENRESHVKHNRG